MSQNDIIDLTDLFNILRVRLSPTVGYCTIYDILGKRTTFTYQEVDSIVDQINQRHLVKTRMKLALVS